jgi:hypothetical protein
MPLKLAYINVMVYLVEPIKFYYVINIIYTVKVKNSASCNSNTS